VSADRLIGFGGSRSDQRRLPTTYTLAAHTSEGDETVVVIADITESATRRPRRRTAIACLVGQLAGGIGTRLHQPALRHPQLRNLIESRVETTTWRRCERSRDANTLLGSVRQLLAFSRRETVKPKVIDVPAGHRQERCSRARSAAAPSSAPR